MDSPNWKPETRNEKLGFERYRNRWSLLTGDKNDDVREIGLTIHAAADTHKENEDSEQK